MPSLVEISHIVAEYWFLVWALLLLLLVYTITRDSPWEVKRERKFDLQEAKGLLLILLLTFALSWLLNRFLSPRPTFPGVALLAFSIAFATASSIPAKKYVLFLTFGAAPFLIYFYLPVTEYLERDPGNLGAVLAIGYMLVPVVWWCSGILLLHKQTQSVAPQTSTPPSSNV